MMALPRNHLEESIVDIRDDVGKWMDLVAISGIPQSTADVMEQGFGINSIGAMQTTIRTEDDLEDFMHGILFDPAGPNLQRTGTDGWEKELTPGNFRMTRWGSALTRIWEDSHWHVRNARSTQSSGGTNDIRAIGNAIEVNLAARGEEPPVPRIDPAKRRDLIKEHQQTWPGLLLRDTNLPGPRYMDQVYNDRKPGKELRYYDWKQVTSVAVEKEIVKKRRARNPSDSSWQSRMMDPDLPQRDNVPSSQYQVCLLWPSHTDSSSVA